MQARWWAISSDIFFLSIFHWPWAIELSVLTIENVMQGGAAGTQQIIIEGPLSEEYYKIRDYLYSQFYSL